MNFTQEAYEHIKKYGFDPHICLTCRELDGVFNDLLANRNLYKSAKDMYEALKSLSLGDIDPIYRQIIVKVLAKADGKGE